MTHVRTRVNTTARPHNPSRSAFTLIELLVVISIIALLIGILLPALGSARQSARALQSLSNVRGITQALSLYANSFEGKYPPNDNTTMNEDNESGVYWYQTPRIGQFLPQLAPGDVGAAGSASETIGGGILQSPNHPDAGRSYTMNFFASAHGDNERRPLRTVGAENIRETGFDASVDFASDVFLVADAWGLSGVRRSDTGDIRWFTNSATGQGSSTAPGVRFGAGAGVSDFPGNWAGGDRQLGGARAPEMGDDGSPSSYIPYNRYPQRSSDPFDIDGSAMFGFADGHASQEQARNLVDNSAGREGYSNYEVLWTPKDRKIDNAFLGGNP